MAGTHEMWFMNAKFNIYLIQATRMVSDILYLETGSSSIVQAGLELKSSMFLP